MASISFVAGAGAVILLRKYFAKTAKAIVEDVSALRKRVTAGEWEFWRSSPEEEIEVLKQRLANLEAGVKKKGDVTGAS